MAENRDEIEDLFAKKEEKSLQTCFDQFRQRKMKDIKIVKQAHLPKNRSSGQLQQLRSKFLELCHKHAGIPYCRKNHAPDSELFNAPYELDCCALIRVAIHEMQDELGIRFGLWNQAYMYDTLPVRFEELNDSVKPGDLIIYAGNYVDGTKKPQKHNIVHVEVYDPSPDNKNRCFGSRWNDGVVQYFDDYKFKASSWSLIKIWFCSIDTWLDGVCRSFCEEHEWLIEEAKLNKKSIFYDESDYRAD